MMVLEDPELISFQGHNKFSVQLHMEKFSSNNDL